MDYNCTIHHAMFAKSNTDHWHALGVAKDGFHDGNEIVTSRIVKIWVDGDNNGVGIQTRNSYYLLDFDTMWCSMDELQVVIDDVDAEAQED